MGCLLYVDEIKVRSNFTVDVAMWHGFHLLEVTVPVLETE